ncbi:PAS domain S-box protein [Evansella sp. AB-P1]|uniref:PAS domain S-box protein n=1 Tax=Evansella sp. AB-P1 TaxID=3037653 RepID=UPI00241FB7AC|nr:PAS domain S-box protein [Evansella sp. AB-P1]MDG5786716.1 PAS domain S-box protein [Evansella sp. AB-P1]
MLQTLFLKNKEEFNTFIDYMVDAIFVMEVEKEGPFFRYIMVNKEGLRQSGLNKDVIGKRIEEVMPSDAASFFIEQYKKALQKKEPYTYEYQSKDGCVGESILTPLVDDETNEVSYIFAVTRDITKRKKAERLLQQSEQKYQSLVEFNSQTVLSMDLKGIIQKVNKMGEKLSGYSLEEIVGSSFVPYLELSEVNKTFEHFEKAIRGESQEYKTKLIHKEGYIIECAVKNVPMIVDGEVIGVFGILQDITEENRVNKAIKESEERYSQLINQSPDAILIHRDGFIEFGNEAAKDLLEIGGSQQLIGKSIFDFHPIRTRNQVKKNIEKLAKSSAKSDLVEERITTINGNEIDVEVSRMEIMFKGNKAIHSVIRDISLRKRMEVALRKSEERYRLIAENTRDLVQLVDVDQKIVYASPSHKRVLGYVSSQLMDKSFRSYIQYDDKEKYDEVFNKIVIGKSHYSTELKVLHETGRLLWLNLDFISIKNDDEEIEKVLIVGEDITKRKEYEFKVHQMAYYDQLTTLPNRSLLKERMNEAMEKAEQKGNQVALLYVDCDNFKPINDELGHDAGDVFLQTLANRLRSSVREEDTVARIGGDEFNILLPNIDDEKQVTEVVENIMAETRKPWTYDGVEWVVTMSIGIALYPTDGKTMNEVVKKADVALYTVKEKGRNDYRWYEKG